MTFIFSWNVWSSVCRRHLRLYPRQLWRPRQLPVLARRAGPAPNSVTAFLPLWSESRQAAAAVGQRPLLAALYDIIFSCQPLWHNGDFLLFTAGTGTLAGEGRPWQSSNASACILFHDEVLWQRTIKSMKLTLDDVLKIHKLHEICKYPFYSLWIFVGCMNQFA